MAGKKVSKKTNSKVVEKVVEKVEVVDEEKVVEKSEIETLREYLSSIQEKVSGIEDLSLKDISKFKKDVVSLVKSSLVLTKKVEKLCNKGVKKVRKNSTSGFDKPIVLTNEATTFVTKHCKNFDKDAVLSRRNVNQYIHAYIKNNDLQNPENRRMILPDKNLKKILSKLSDETNKNGTKDSEVGYSYFNLQKYIKHIFVKQDA